MKYDEEVETERLLTSGSSDFLQENELGNSHQGIGEEGNAGIVTVVSATEAAAARAAATVADKFGGDEQVALLLCRCLPKLQCGATTSRSPHQRRGEEAAWWH